MDGDFLTRTVIPHLAGQFERAVPILFTGAGFSAAAKNLRGQPMPLGKELKKQLWTVCFPGEPYDDGASLQSLYQHAVLRHSRQIKELLGDLLSVDAATIPDWYRPLLSAPWHRCYTLNVDDLEEAAVARWDLPRGFDVISATSDRHEKIGRTRTAALEFVHLNGTKNDLPEAVTFSTTQYAERLARPEPWYVRLVSDLISRCCVFIGTQLDESPFWQHLELRRMRGGREARELRPRSYLITPSLDLPRKALLAEYNIAWLPMNAKQFVDEVLTHLQEAVHKGQTRVGADTDTKKVNNLPEVSALASYPSQLTQFLLGEEPVWADLQSGRAIERLCDRDLWNQTELTMKRQMNRGIILVSGTAGSGKSTALMRLCLRLVAAGTHVGFLNKDIDLSPRDIRGAMRRADAPEAIAIDDADMYGSELLPLIRDVASGPTSALVMVAMRSARVDRVFPSDLPDSLPMFEYAMPPLEDSDIESLLDVLDRENRLGVLKGRTRVEQRAAFREKSGRQLLVAMIEATSGRRFEEKCVDEYLDMQGEDDKVYALISVATSFRYGLYRDEVLTALNDYSNATLNAIDQLIRRHVIIQRQDGAIWARHRVIADFVRDHLQVSGQMVAALNGLCLVAATKVSPTMAWSERPFRILSVLFNHDTLIKAIGIEEARNLYGSLEGLLHWYFHFWLQRGSLEVEVGDVKLAEHFLNQARALNANDPYVENEWAYLLFARAIRNPQSPRSQELVEEAVQILHALIQIPRNNPYPYHVLCAQGLNWTRVSQMSPNDKVEFLAELVRFAKEGRVKYPSNERLKVIAEDLQREYLGTAVVN